MALMKTVIMKKTISAVAANGIDGFSVKSVAKECGCSEGLVFHYFGSKKNLVGICYHHICDEFTKAMREDIGDAATLRQLWLSYRGFMERNKELARFCLDYLQSNTSSIEGLEFIRDSVAAAFPKKDEGFLGAATRFIAIIGCLRAIGLIQWDKGCEDDYIRVVEEMIGDLS